MKKAALFVSGLLLSAVVCAPAMAEVVRVRLLARVSQVSDPGNLLNGKIIVGTRVTGTYVYNTNTPNVSQNPEFGQYQPFANEARMRFAAGGFVFENNQPTQQINIFIDPEGPFPSGGTFLMSSFDNKPLSNGVSVNDISFRFEGTGTVTRTAVLPAVAPSLRDYFRKELIIGGGGQSFLLNANIESAELIVTDAMEVSPASGSFVPNQQFDAALTLPANSDVLHAQAMANGAPLPLGYPGYCTLLPPNSAGKPALLCPAADAVLPLAAGAPIEWNVELTNGTTLTETVEWKLAQ